MKEQLNGRVALNSRLEPNDKLEAQKISSVKMLKGTKAILDSMELEGTQQEKLDKIVKEYKNNLEIKKGLAKQKIEELDLEEDFNAFSSDFKLFTSSIQKRINEYIHRTVNTTAENNLKDFRAMQDEFMGYLKEVQESVTEDTNVKELKEVIAELLETADNLTEDKKKLMLEVAGLKDIEIAFKEATTKNNRLEANIKEYEVEVKSLKTSLKETENNLKTYKLKSDELELKLGEASILKNVELEKSLLIANSKAEALEGTLNTVNSFVNTLVEAKATAEEKSVKLEAENKKLLDENKKLLEQIEKLKK